MQRRVGPNRIGQLNIIRFYHTSSIKNNNNNKYPFAIKYYNIDINKLKILSDNKNKAGVYLWIHLDSGKKYVGSAFDISIRLSNYLNLNYLKNNNSMYIYKALLYHGYSAFSLSILEYINVSELLKKEARKLITKREQYYIDNFNPEYNLNPNANSRLGSKHSVDTIIKMSKENNHFYGKTHTTETKTSISKTLSGRTLSIETKTKISLAHKGKSISVSILAKLSKKCLYIIKIIK